MTKLALCDFDGTLYDTNDVNYYAYSEALKKYNVKLDYDYYCKHCNGRNYKEFIPELLGNDREAVEDVHRVKQELYPQNLAKAKMNDHLFNMIDSLRKECGYKIAIVTTASRKNVEAMLKATGKDDFFDLLVCGEDVKNYKPDPECYFLAMEKLGGSPEETIIFEDSAPGIAAAEATGGMVFSVSNFS